MVIEMLAASELELSERVHTLETHLAIERDFRSAAVDTLRDRTIELDRLRERHQRLLDEYRHLRTQTMREASAA
jgi:hypothetical protein